MRSFRSGLVVASCTFLAILTACGIPTHQLTVHTPEKPVNIVLMKDTGIRAPTVSPIAAATEALRKQKREVDLVSLLILSDAMKKNEEAARTVSIVHQSSAVVTAPIQAPTDLAGVMQCIKDHESGNYAESSHPSAGSGAYQFIPSTWRTWAERSGHTGYDYAYQAPPEVQDAVIVYALTNGGAGNWDPAYGDDPCTVSMR